MPPKPQRILDGLVVVLNVEEDRNGDKRFDAILRIARETTDISKKINFYYYFNKS